MAWREAIVPARLNVQQFVEWVSIRQPRCAFLIGGEQIARGVKRHADRKTHACADDFSLPARQNLQDRPSLASHSVIGAARLLVDAISLVPFIAPEAEINLAGLVD